MSIGSRDLKSNTATTYMFSHLTLTKFWCTIHTNSTNVSASGEFNTSLRLTIERKGFISFPKKTKITKVRVINQARDTVGMRKGTRILQAGGIILSKNRTRSSVAQMTKTTVPEVRSQYDRWKGGKESGVREVENRRRRE